MVFNCSRKHAYRDSDTHSDIKNLHIQYMHTVYDILNILSGSKFEVFGLFH